MVSSMKRGSGMAGACLKHHQIHFLKYSAYTLHDVIMMSLSNGHSFQFMHMKFLRDGCLRIFVAGAMMCYGPSATSRAKVGMLPCKVTTKIAWKQRLNSLKSGTLDLELNIEIG